jgi:hypothetical protein
MKDVSDSNFKIIEIYPQIYVYKNLFNNIEEVYSMLKKSENNDESNYFSNWSQWSHFGKYLAPVAPNWESRLKDKNVDGNTDLQREQKKFLVSLVDNFHLATRDYAAKHNIDINDDTCKIYDPLHNDKTSEVWQVSEMTICKYDQKIGMSYHSDFIPYQRDMPGYKFAITGLAYFNDDYEGGEIDFCVNKKMIKYKPVAGDFLVFPSGHPDILTEDGTVYLHGVMPTSIGNKYFSRMYWTKYDFGSDEWHENEQKFGTDSWSKMYEKIQQERQDSHPPRFQIPDSIRIQ